MTERIDAEYITKEGLQNIKDELAFLKTTKREELRQKLEAAISQGDLKENADYHAAKEEQGFAEGRIRDLEDVLRRAVVIEDRGPSDVVRVGSTVTIVEEADDFEEKYRIVGPKEADPANGLISNESPMGRALLGARIGQTVSVESPGGQIMFVVRAIG